MMTRRVLFSSRWALSYLRGPLTGPEIARVMAPAKAARAAAKTSLNPAASAVGAASASTAASTSPSPAPPSAPPARPQAGGPEYFLPAISGAGGITYKPMVAGFAKLHFIDAKLTLDQWRTSAYLAPLSDNGSEVLWPEATVAADLKSRADEHTCRGRELRRPARPGNASRNLHCVEQGPRRSSL